MVMDDLKIEPKAAEQPPRAGARRALAGLLVRKERWGLSLRGKLLLCAVLVLLSAVVIRAMYPFLAVSERVSGNVLVVEGWIPTYSLPEAAREFKADLHQRVIVARALYKSPSKYESGAVMVDYIAENLITEGIPRERVHTVMIEAGRRDRTYSSAEAVKQWLQASGVPIKSLDVVTIGPHARRSRLLYQKAFGNAVRVGVIALQDASYDPRRWWRYSAGLREVPPEAAAYVYSKFFFSPE
jgi:uncharacterized SAM-binding protein YcdF (DUF218 family)